MLSIGRLGIAGGAEYYLEKVANNVDDYYLGRGEAPGQWVGATATRSDSPARSKLTHSGTCSPADPPPERTWACSSARKTAGL